MSDAAPAVKTSAGGAAVERSQSGATAPQSARRVVFVEVALDARKAEAVALEIRVRARQLGLPVEDVRVLPARRGR